MPPFPKPRSSFDYDLDSELVALREHRKVHGVPPRRRDRLLLATWNIAKLNKGVGTFDFDNAPFRDLWNAKRPQPFFAFMRYYVSDHRPLWAEFTTERGAS